MLLPIPVVSPLARQLASSFRRLAGSFSAWRFARDLRLLHDVLAGTDLAGRYWVACGVLLGWARERRLLRHDLHDADFGLLAEDMPLLEAALPALCRAGFRPVARVTANDGRIGCVRFNRRRRRHPTWFEFFAYDRIDGQLRYHDHTRSYPGWHEGLPPVELEYRVPEQELVPFDFLGRTWLRHTDVDLELTSIYGDWRTPNPNWEWFWDDRSAFCCRVWTNPDTLSEV